MITRFRSHTYFLPYFFAILYALSIIVPLYFVLVSSFKENIEIFNNPLALPRNWRWENYLRAQEYVNLSGAMMRSVLITAVSEIFVVLLAFPAAYAIARIRTPLSALMESIFGFGFLIPAFAVLVPIFLLMANLNLLYNPLALMLFYPATRLPISVLIIASYMRQIPRDIEDCAMIDGANRLQLIWRVFFPLAAPGLITVIILNFIAFWNEYLFASILLNTPNRTAQMAVTMLKGEHSIDYGLIAAGIVITVIPVYLIFIFFQDRIVNGMMAGSVKG